MLPLRRRTSLPFFDVLFLLLSSLFLPSAQAVNNLQSTFSGFGFISSENVFKARMISLSLPLSLSLSLELAPNGVTFYLTLFLTIPSSLTGLRPAAPAARQGHPGVLSQGRSGHCIRRCVADNKSFFLHFFEQCIPWPSDVSYPGVLVPVTHTHKHIHTLFPFARAILFLPQPTHGRFLSPSLQV